MPFYALVLFLCSSPQSLLLEILLCWEVSFLVVGSLPWAMDYIAMLSALQIISVLLLILDWDGSSSRQTL